jgi:hypothetical protein
MQFKTCKHQLHDLTSGVRKTHKSNRDHLTAKKGGKRPKFDINPWIFCLSSYTAMDFTFTMS